MNSKKRILVAPLNWGLGHATRCIPIINALITEGYEPIIASDGMALQLLRKEFQNISYIELPSYNIRYSKHGKNLRLMLVKDSPKIFKAIRSEKKQVKQLVKSGAIDGIISDNRFGVYSKKVPSVFITHQLNVLSGNTTWFTSKLHQKIIKKFNICWVPDVESEPSLSGKLGHIDNFSIPVKYLGTISRLNKIDCKVIYDVLVLLSGPEPQRSILESLLFEILKQYDGKVLFVRGVVESEQTVINKGKVKIINFLESKALEEALNRSQLVLARSGYTTILDLAKIGKKAFFIPTPGQFEQEYLARYIESKGIAPYCIQQKFSLDQLERIKDYTGFKRAQTQADYKSLFNLFKSKGELTSNTKLTFNV